MLHRFTLRKKCRVWRGMVCPTVFARLNPGLCDDLETGIVCMPSVGHEQ